MTRDKRVGLGLLGAAAGLGLAGDLLFQGRPFGLNVALFTVLFVLALAWLLRVARAPLHQGRRWMAAPLLLFSAGFLWHESPLLVAANLIAVAGAVSIGALRRTDPSPVRAGVDDYAAAAAAAGFGAFGGAVRLLQREVPWAEAERALRGTRTASMARGLAVGLPLVLLFGGLFVAADSVFQQLVTSAIPNVSGLGTHLLLGAAIAWPAAGLLRDLVAETRVLEPERLAGRGLSLGTTEIAIALIALDVLFAAFVTVQAGFLFGHRAGVSYATYARRGFFELVAVSILVLPVVLGANALARERVRLVRALSAVLVGLELAVALSALERLRLYQEQFGLTELRIYASGVVVWLAGVFVWLMLTTLRGRRFFAVGALALGFAATAAVNVLDPDALIARTNLSRPHVDASYLAHLSDDAVPTLLARLPTLRRPLRAELARDLLARYERHNGWVSWNRARSRARTALRQHHAELLRFAR